MAARGPAEADPIAVLVDRWPVGHAATCVLRVDPAAGVPEVVHATGPDDRVFQWASLTKLCTALALAVAVEETTVELDEPAGPPGSTVAHLLAHTSGLGPDGGSLAPPARRRIYSNAGFEVLGRHLSERAAMPYTRYLAEAVLDPLGMRSVEVTEPGAASQAMRGTVADLRALATELLHPTLVSRATMGRAATVAFPGLDGVLPGFGVQRPCDWGLGFELRDGKSPHYTGVGNDPGTFGHFGRAGGMCWVDHVAGMAVAVLTDEPFGPWAAEAWPAYSDAVLHRWRPPLSSAPR